MAGPCFFLLSAAADHREVVVAAAGEGGHALLTRGPGHWQLVGLKVGHMGLI